MAFNSGVLGGAVAGVIVALVMPLLLKRKAKNMETPDKDVTFKAFAGAMFLLVFMGVITIVSAVCAFACLMSDMSWWIGPLIFIVTILLAMFCILIFKGLKDKVIVGPDHLVLDGARVDSRNMNEWRKLTAGNKRYYLDLKWTDIKEIRMVNMVLYFSLDSGESYALPLGCYDSKLAPTISKFMEVKEWR